MSPVLDNHKAARIQRKVRELLIAAGLPSYRKTTKTPGTAPGEAGWSTWREFVGHVDGVYRYRVRVECGRKPSSRTAGSSAFDNDLANKMARRCWDVLEHEFDLTPDYYAASFWVDPEAAV